MSLEGADQIPMSAVSKPLCRLHALPGRTAGTCILAKGLLPLLLCLGWLWGATPVAAQDQASPPMAEVTGPYRNLAENHAGTFHLTREEGTVYATLRTDRSPVQFLARDQPEVLFTVPEGFRPVLPVTWEVSAEPVLPDGTPHPDQPDRRVFRMRVDRQGHVRYVDDVGVDGVGYLRYRTALAWPLAGTEPRLCERPRKIREGILASVQTLNDAALHCSEVDWEHLARIRTLSLSDRTLALAWPDALDADADRQALLGLTNLATLKVSAPDMPPLEELGHHPRWELPADLLAHTPRLERLELWPDDSLLVLPTGWFRYIPLLTQLSFGSLYHMDLSDDLLAPIPHLESLYLGDMHPSERARLLAQVPHLIRLTVRANAPLPETLLTDVPRLTHLTLSTHSPLPETLLAPVPHLTHLELRNINDPDLPANLLAPVPRLESLHLESWHPAPWSTDPYSASAPGLVLRLSHVPRLTRLTVDGRTSLPETFLKGVSHLTHLTVTVREGLELPDALLAPVPRLTHLTVHGRDGLELPGDWLAPVPDLESLDLEGQYPAAVLARLLTHVPHLTHLTLGVRVTGTTVLPEHLLAYMPHLTHLTLKVAGTTALPARLLAQVPALAHLTLKGVSLALPNGSLNASSLVLPDAFFAHVPHLTALTLGVTGSLSLPARLLDPVPQLTELQIDIAGITPSLSAAILTQAPHLEAFPADFLTQAPHLEALHLRANKLKAFPANFLTQAPHLETLSLDVGSLEAFPADFLTHTPHLESLHLRADNLEAFPTGFLAHVPRLKAFHLFAWEYGPPPGLTSLPAGFLSHAPQLVELHLHVPRLRALPPDFLAHAPRLETLELDYSRYVRDYGNHSKEVTPLTALPEGFLSHAPRLQQLKLELGLVTEFPEDFLAHAPQLRHLSLDANGVSALPPGFLARHSELETVRLLANGVANLPRGFLDRSPNLRSLLLDLQQVEALPEGFLMHATRLHEAELGVNRVATLPPDFLVHAFHLVHLDLRALNLTALPADFLADAPRLRMLGLAMPLLEPTLTPGHRLWNTLQAASLRVKVTRSDPILFKPRDPAWGPLCEDKSLSDINVEIGDILEVRERTRDDHDRRLLRVVPWRNRELSVTFWGYGSCPYLIDARFTEPTLAVCAANRKPDACAPVRDYYRLPEPFPFRG